MRGMDADGDALHSAAAGASSCQGGQAASSVLYEDVHEQTSREEPQQSVPEISTGIAEPSVQATSNGEGGARGVRDAQQARSCKCSQGHYFTYV